MAKSSGRQLEEALRLASKHPEAFVTEGHRASDLALRERFPEIGSLRTPQEREEALRLLLPQMLWHDLRRLRILRNRVTHESFEPEEGDIEITQGTIKLLISFLGIAEPATPAMPAPRRDWQAFQTIAQKFFEEELRTKFNTEVTLDLPSGETHRFDLVSLDSSILIECKSYTWTESGYEPAAKLNHAKTDARHLLATNANRKILAFEDDLRPKDGKSLAELFARRNRKWLGDVEIWRYLGGKMKCVRPLGS